MKKYRLKKSAEYNNLNIITSRLRIRLLVLLSSAVLICTRQTLTYFEMSSIIKELKK